MKRERLCKIILVLFLVLLGGIIAFYESQTHYMLLLLDKFGICRIDAELHPRFHVIQAWAASLRKMQLDVDVAFIGDSHTAGAEFNEEFPDKKIVMLGVGGDCVGMVEDRLPTVVAVNPKKLFVLVGINDLYRVDSEVLLERYERLMSRIKNELPETSVYIQSIIPVDAEQEKQKPRNEEVRKANRRICELCLKYGFTFVDIYSKLSEDSVLPAEFTKDGVHLNAAGYKVWASEIVQYLE